MGFREIRNLERITEQDERERREREEGYRKIKPSTDITAEEAKAFWDNIFLNRLS